MNTRQIIQNYFDLRRVTRDDLTSSLAADDQVHRPALHSVDAMLRQKLLDAGKAVCRIDIKGHPEGTGFHLGNGWVMTCQHVICHGDEEESYVCCATFTFPDIEVPARPRTVLVSKFHDPPNTPACSDSKKDLALIHLPEIENTQMFAFGSASIRAANINERVFLIHYGDGVTAEDDLFPQQFSVSANFCQFSVGNVSGNRFMVHTAHCRHGASGAPLLLYDEARQELLLAGVHYAGVKEEGNEDDFHDILDSPGYALWIHRENWLKETIYPVHTCLNVIPLYGSSSSNVCALLQAALDERYMHVYIPRTPPEGVVPTNYPAITWSEGCTCDQPQN